MLNNPQFMVREKMAFFQNAVHQLTGEWEEILQESTKQSMETPHKK